MVHTADNLRNDAGSGVSDNIPKVDDGGALSQSASEMSIYSTSSAMMTSEESTTGLSAGAEKLFQTLESLATESENDVVEENATKGTRDLRNSSTGASYYESESVPPSRVHGDTIADTRRIPTKLFVQPHMESNQSSRAAEKHNLAMPWRETLPGTTYSTLLKRYGKLEMQRQELIWRLFESELFYIRSLQTALKVFIHPLLTKQRLWMSGVPTKLTRLFDWYDDIYQLHSKIYATLRDLHQSQYPVVLHISESLRQFIPQLEIYQPYLARISDVLSLVKFLMEDGYSDFGEFLRIQHDNEASGGVSLTSFLYLPVERLGAYQELFRVSGKLDLENNCLN